ncbi:hypothetical protein HTZ77_38370 [Nonomuraea sp. SMC257]|uniref:Uncharacterized protein n=1 Tax=Nonomuraea montanisoli TaxID=2741721 RepID=A0A7Y6IFA5_9ACTN|nr:hypothetical protein [Nonomuraea montanisoli]NUW37230.1 hypothetical protein [Nonomuraea montanisoli]
MSPEAIHQQQRLADPPETAPEPRTDPTAPAVEDTADAAATHRRRGARVLVAALAAVALAAGGVAVFQYVRAHAPRPADGGTPPWPIPADPLPGIRAAGLTHGPMGHAEHYHAHLSVFVDGDEVEVPADIGIVGEEMSPLHTHDDRGVIHVEPHTKGEVFTLGQLFKQWGVTLSATQIGSLRAGAGRTLAAEVNGVPVTGDPAAIVVKAHEQIALVYGKPDPSFKAPPSFTFKPDE